MSVSFVDIDWRGRRVTIEHEWVGAEAGPVIVLLHEGLGSLAMWKDFPARLCAAVGARGLVFSRPGYGRSTPRAADERWAPDFMHRQAYEVLPALFDALHVDASKAWLFGHSDGGSIALLYAARFSAQLGGIVVAAPHILVEDVSVTSIEQAKLVYEAADSKLKSGLAKYHDDPDSAFWGWNRIWLDPAFRAWNIEAEIAAIRCPVLAVQGLDDEYGTLEQIRGIARRVPQTELLELPACGHSPHRDQSEALIAAVAAFTVARSPQAR